MGKSIAVKQRNQVFVTIPKFVEGIPATLGTVTNRSYEGNPLIKPYPNWQWHRNPEGCRTDRIVSVFRVKVNLPKKVLVGLKVCKILD